MHLFFPGTVKNLLLDVMEWASPRKKGSSLRNHLLLKTKKLKEQKEMNMVRNLKKEVTIGANGTRDYVIKQGPNKGKIADKGQ